MQKRFFREFRRDLRDNPRIAQEQRCFFARMQEDISQGLNYLLMAA
jgi:hypothetical protein